MNEACEALSRDQGSKMFQRKRRNFPLHTILDISSSRVPLCLSSTYPSVRILFFSIERVGANGYNRKPLFFRQY